MVRRFKELSIESVKTHAVCYNEKALIDRYYQHLMENRKYYLFNYIIWYIIIKKEIFLNKLYTRIFD